MRPSEEVLKWIEVGISSINLHDPQSVGFKNGLMYVRWLINGQVPCYESPRCWIPCSKQLPKDDKNKLVTVHFKGYSGKGGSGFLGVPVEPCFYVDVASYDGDGWLSSSDEYKLARDSHEVIAWRELPKPYEARGEAPDPKKLRADFEARMRIWEEGGQ